MNIFKIVFLCALFAIGLSSCGETCKTCTAEQVIMQGDEEVGRQSVAGVEYCGDALDEIEDQVITTNQEIGGLTQTSVTTYTCD